jgi:septum site-determining protein MinD
MIDSPAGLNQAFYCAVEGADRALLVTTPQLYALRDAQKVAEILQRYQISDSRLIINMLRIKHMSKGYSKNVDQIIDMICLPLIGIVPYDDNVTSYANSDEDIMQNGKLLVTHAFTNIANRICGNRVPILKIKRGLFY